MRVLRSAALLLAPPAFCAASEACAPCHRAIYDSYRLTPMARSAGIAGSAAPPESFARASFTHAPSGFQYQVSPGGDRYFLEFGKVAGGSRGRKELVYFIGSGAPARSYILAHDGFLFQAPVSYYGNRWDLAPGYQQYAYPYVTRPIQPACLTCHASFLEPIAGTQNRYGTPPFGEGGVACERCHGPGEAHIGRMRAGRAGGEVSIVNPARLAPDRRASICAQCHLSGEVRVMRPGANWKSYRPGDRLSDSMTVFVREGGGPGMMVTSHVEKLAQSACQRASGVRMWCGTCHDPHRVPEAGGRAAWFRGKCMNCHTLDSCRETRMTRLRVQDDCTACHMPETPAMDAQHIVATDHSIPRGRRPAPRAPSEESGLVLFGGGAATSRDLALAYAITAPRARTATYQERALKLLEEAARGSPDDVEVLIYLAEIYRNKEQDERAEPLYRRALRLDGEAVAAMVGLGVIHFRRGEDAAAIRHWQDALTRNPGLDMVRTNLAMAEWRSGDRTASRVSLDKALALSPAFGPAADLLRRLLSR